MRTKEQNLALKRLIEAAFDYADFVGRKEIREVLEALITNSIRRGEEAKRKGK